MNKKYRVRINDDLEQEQEKENIECKIEKSVACVDDGIG